MKIANGHVVEFEYTLKNMDGEILESNKGKDAVNYLHGHGGIIPGLERELVGLAKGDTTSVTVKPEDAYGVRNDGLVRTLSRADLKGVDDLKVGLQLEGRSGKEIQVFTVTAIAGDDVTLDGNHPLAGEQLSFDIKIVSVRAATKEELAHGHAHGPGGHHHH